MARKLNYNLVVTKMKAINLRIFSRLDFERLFQTSRTSAQKFIENHAGQNNLFSRLKNGIYAFNLNPPGDELIAAKLYQPSYISFEYALSYYSIIPESVYTITSATTKPTREFKANDKIFAYHRLKKELYTGFAPATKDTAVFHLALPEKALFDYLYLVSLKIKSPLDRMDLTKIKQRKLKSYLALAKNKALVNLINQLYA